jgi:hypothetical protein
MPDGCVLCEGRGVDRPAAESSTTCEPCRAWLARTIDQVAGYAALAARSVARTTKAATSAHAFGSRPPLVVEALDPELAMIALNAGDESSEVTILAMCEMWERAVREDRHLAPYGPASEARHATTTAAALRGCTGFLARQVDWMTTTPGFDLAGFADHVRRAAAILRRWDIDAATVGTRLACPAILDDGAECGAVIRLEPGGDAITCRGCGHAWTALWLLQVAGSGIDAWADLEAAARYSSLSERSIRRWAATGRVRRRGLLYSLGDLAAEAHRMTLACTTSSSAC